MRSPPARCLLPNFVDHHLFTFPRAGKYSPAWAFRLLHIQETQWFRNSENGVLGVIIWERVDLSLLDAFGATSHPPRPGKPFLERTLRAKTAFPAAVSGWAADQKGGSAG